MAKKIGLALGGGGARGLAHIGVLKVLREAGIGIDLVCGTSMGAVVGACAAIGIDVAEMETKALAMRKRDMAKLLDLTHPAFSILKGNKLGAFIAELLGDAGFDDAKIPFAAVATDLYTGEEVVLRSGKLIEALQASFSVPGIFPPVRIGERYLIDGGLVNPTPVDVCLDMGADAVIGVDLVASRVKAFSRPTTINVLLQAYEIIRTQSVRYKLEHTRGKSVIISPDTGGALDSFRFTDVAAMIAHGEKAARDKLPEIIKLAKF